MSERFSQGRLGLFRQLNVVLSALTTRRGRCRQGCCTHVSSVAELQGIQEASGDTDEMAGGPKRTGEQTDGGAAGGVGSS